MRKSLLILLTAAFTLAAADATGTYTGTFVPDDGNEGPALVVLKQTGDAITGTAGPSEEHRMDITAGKVVGDKVTFEVAQGENVMKFELTLKGEELVGQATRERDGQRQIAKLNLKRVKA
jgi:hypothetical protein